MSDRCQQTQKTPLSAAFFASDLLLVYNVDSISKPQASRRASGMYFEFLFRRAHSRRRVDRMYWSGLSLNSFTICSKEVTVGTTGPIGSGLPQFGFPRRFAIGLVSLKEFGDCHGQLANWRGPCLFRGRN